MKTFIPQILTIENPLGPCEGLVRCLKRLPWHQTTLANTVMAAFAKAIWLGASVDLAMYAVSTQIHTHNLDVSDQQLWDWWFATVRQLAAQTFDLEAA